MKYDGKLDIAVGFAVNSKKWNNKQITWNALVQKLSEERKTTETFKEYLSATRDEQTKIKDVGGYVGGYLKNGKRSPQAVVHRQLLTLDVDFAHINFWDDFRLQFNNAAVLHATHKHHKDSPRYRLVMPINRKVTPDEYVAIGRYIAGLLGIEMFDNTTFETNRLMFWPSNPRDIDYYFNFQDGPWVDADEVLNTYEDWSDSSLWPTSEKQFDKIKNNAEKQADPLSKRGIVGAFCRAYGIHEAIETFLSDIYEPTAFEDRYTYKKGSTAAGLIVYGDKFAFSHHGTDPSGQRLNNAFDFVRIHKFGSLDGDEWHGTSNKESFDAMKEFALEDNKVKDILFINNRDTAALDFFDYIDDEYEEDEIETKEWHRKMKVDPRGGFASTAVNINTIFANDSRLDGVFKINKFDNKIYVFKTLPWRKISKPEPIRNVDFSGVRNYIESIYGIMGNLKIEDSMNLAIEKHSFHPVREYLDSLKWDGIERVDTLLIDYFGCDDSLYTREAMRKTLLGAVSRIYKPGSKFDLVLTLVGEQGCGKSTFFNKLGKHWFSDTFTTVQGKEAYEQLHGAWIIEMAELSGLRKAEVESIKHFITKQEDSFRPAYGRTSETYPRQCVFVGTTNTSDFLRDPSGNRRFNPVQVNTKNKTKCVFTELTEEEIDQIWAEAVEIYNTGEIPMMSIEASKLAVEEQYRHSETDERTGLILEYLDTLLPEDWDSRDLYERRDYFNDQLVAKDGTVERKYVCSAEVWSECLGKNPEEMSRYKTREVNDMLRALPGWKQGSSTKNFKLYGVQKYYERENNRE